MTWRVFLESDTPLLSARLSISETLVNLSNFIAHPSTDQGQDVVELLNKFSSILGDAPTLTNVLQHDIKVSNIQPIKKHQKLVNLVLADVPNCSAFLDDLTVFKCLEKASLTLNLAKCEIGN